MAVMENQAMLRIVSEYYGEGIKLEDILKCQITNECLSLFITNRTIIKNQDLKLLQVFNSVKIQQSQLEQYVAEVEMGFIWSLSILFSEDSEKIMRHTV